MGLNDAREQLEVCKAHAVSLEHQLAAALKREASASREVADLRIVLRQADERNDRLAAAVGEAAGILERAAARLERHP